MTVSIAIFCAMASGQEPAKPDADAQSGMCTGAPRPPVKDAQMRPITAGGFVDWAPVYFLDVTHQAGLDKFHHRSGEPAKTTILETPGSGVALLDYDNDGWLDIYLLNGSTVAALKGKEQAPRAMLLHNNHDGTFTDVTVTDEAAALSRSRRQGRVPLGFMRLLSVFSFGSPRSSNAESLPQDRAVTVLFLSFRSVVPMAPRLYGHCAIIC